MAANIQLNEGTSGKYAKTTEVTSGIHLGQTQLTNSSGTEVGTAAVPVQVSLANTGANTNKLLVTADAITGAVTATLANSAKIDCNSSNVTIAGGSIGNTSFAATQGTASNLKTEAHLYDSSTNGIGSTSNALDINIKSGNPTTITATQGTGSNLKSEVTNAGTFATQNTPAIGGGQTLLNYTATNSASGDLIALNGSKSIYVVAYSLITADTTGTIITFQDNASTSVWTIKLQALTGTICGANLATSAPNYIFKAGSGNKLSCLNSGSKDVIISLTYFQV